MRKYLPDELASTSEVITSLVGEYWPPNVNHGVTDDRRVMTRDGHRLRIVY